MRELLIEYYLSKEDTREASFMKSKNLFNRRKSFHRHWVDSRMKEMKDQGEPITKALASYDKWIESRKEVRNRANKRNGSVNKAIPEDIENFMRDLIKQMALCGQGIGKKALTEFFTHALKDRTNENDRTFSRSTLDRFIWNYHLECKTVKNIDPVRIAQVTPENRDAFFFRIDQIVSLLHDIDPINCPWKSWKEVSSKNIDNMDEMGSDSTRHRDSMLIPKETTQRLFQSTPEGNQVKAHITLAVFSRSNGHYKNKSTGIEGAPMPMVIHTKASSSTMGKSGPSPIEKRVALYEEQEFIDVDLGYLEGFSQDNPLGITVKKRNLRGIRYSWNLSPL